VDVNGVGGWNEFRTFSLLYLLKSCTFSMHGKMSAVLAILTERNAKVNGS
jgi:hypothetical protein